MSSLASPPCARKRSRRPFAREGFLLRGEVTRPLDDSATTAASRRSVPRIIAGTRAESAPVLLAGADARRRAILRGELSARLPTRTRFAEAAAVPELLERAPASRMVILAGDLENASRESLLHMLGQRHPRLPVVSVDGESLQPALVGERG